MRTKSRFQSMTSRYGVHLASQNCIYYEIKNNYGRIEKQKSKKKVAELLEYEKLEKLADKFTPRVGGAGKYISLTNYEKIQTAIGRLQNNNTAVNN